MKLDALDHPKTLDLASRLDVTRPTVIGHLELLWAFTGKQSSQGNVGKWPDGAIARACDWMGPAEVFITALVDSGFLDRDPSYRLTVHDWSDHAPGWVRAKLKKAGLEFITSSDGSREPTREPSSDGSSDPPESTSEPSLEPSILAKRSEVKCSEGKSRVLTNPVEPERSTANGSSLEATEKIPSAAIERVFDHWRTVHNHPRAQLDRKRRKLIADALRAYSEADLCQSISGYRNSPHHMGQNDRDTVYDSIDLFLRDAKHIDDGLRFYRDPPRTDLSPQTRRIIDQTEDWVPPEVRYAAE